MRQFLETAEGAVWTAAERSERLAGGAGAGKAAAESADETDTASRLRRGNLGEREAAEALAANGFDVLEYKPALKETNKPGIDMVALKDDHLYLVDNKALTRAGDVYSVSALTTNIARNLDDVRKTMAERAADVTRSQDERQRFQAALDAIDARRVILAVTNANVASDQQLLSDVSDRLKAAGLRFIDVMRTSDEQARDRLLADGFDVLRYKGERRVRPTPA